MSTIFGRWSRDGHHRGVIQATVVHRELPEYPTLSFVVDTASDRTFIVPYHERKYFARHALPLQGPVMDVETVAGPMPFMYLAHCSLMFLDATGALLAVTDIPVYFGGSRPTGLISKAAAALFGRRLPRVGEGQHYSVLGRDVLNRLALGYCNPTNILFMTTDTDDYSTALRPVFPRP